jgi:hypothetical protein
MAALRPDMTVRQVAYDFPACREVFIRYGEPAERTPFGHLIALDSFARQRGVPLDQLLEELASAAGLTIDWAGYLNRTVHRPLLAGALLLGVTLGAGWGTWLLWEIGLRQTFTAAAPEHIVAHGDAQFWGFLAPFIAGIALRWLPTANATPPASRVGVVCITAGLLLGALSGFLWALHPAAWLGAFSATCLLVAAGSLAAFLLRRTMPRLAWPWAQGVAAAGLWLCVWALHTAWLRTLAGTEGPRALTLAQRTATIELAVFGLAANAVYGFGLRLLPGIVGGSADERRARIALGLHNLGTLLLVSGTLLARPGVELVGIVGVLSAALLFASALPGLRNPKTFSRRPEQGPAALAYYAPLAIGWLIAGVGLWLAGQVWALTSGHPMPHAWRGAARHALTVGFLTTIILGVGQRLVPILEHTLLAWPRLAAPILVLVAVGNLWRVGAELGTLVWPAAFFWMPVSSLLELSALMLFAANLLRTLWPPPDPLVARRVVTPQTSLAACLEAYPWLEDRMLQWGLSYLERTRSVPRELTLRSVAESHGWSPGDLVAAIQQALAEADASSPSPQKPSGG